MKLRLRSAICAIWFTAKIKEIRQTFGTYDLGHKDDTLSLLLYSESVDWGCQELKLSKENKVVYIYKLHAGGF